MYTYRGTASFVCTVENWTRVHSGTAPTVSTRNSSTACRLQLREMSLQWGHLDAARCMNPAVAMQRGEGGGGKAVPSTGRKSRRTARAVVPIYANTRDAQR